MMDGARRDPDSDTRLPGGGPVVAAASVPSKGLSVNARGVVALAAAAICGGAAYLVSAAIGGIAGVGVAILTGIVVYAVAIRLTGALDEDDLAHILQAASFLPASLHGTLTRYSRLLLRSGRSG